MGASDIITPLTSVASVRVPASEVLKKIQGFSMPFSFNHSRPFFQSIIL